MSILIYHMCHNQQNPYILNWIFWNNTLPLDLLFTNLLVYEVLFWKKICLSVIIYFKLGFPRYIIMCCMWYICSHRTKIRIHLYRVCYFYIPKSLYNCILNVPNIIISKNGFKVMMFLHIYCDT